MSEPKTKKEFINSLQMQSTIWNHGIISQRGAIVALLVLLLVVPSLALILMWLWIFRLLTKAEGWESRLWLIFGLVLFTIITLAFFSSTQEPSDYNPCPNPPNDSMTSLERLDASLEHKKCIHRLLKQSVD